MAGTIPDVVKPNFFIVGAIKSATTSLVYHLMRHPQVHIPLFEFNYLADDLIWLKRPFWRSEEQYLDYFKRAKGSVRIGEKSVFYLPSETAAKRIRDLNPDAKIVCILRNPVDAIESLYRHNMVNYFEVLVPFRRALDAEADRRLGKRIPPGTDILHNLFYRKMVDYAPQVERYYDVFGPRNVLVLLLDDLRRNPQGTYKRLLEFLQLEYVDLGQYPVLHVNQNDAFLPVRTMLRKQRRIARLIDRVPRPAISAAKRAIRKIVGPPRWARYDPNLRKLLEMEMRPGIIALGKLINRDLRGWTRD